jgi:glutathione synthase/RimK-type ligase-like ATP-grasp enzyme
VGKPVFPSVATCWHYDDKVGQKYLLEAIHAPLAKSYVFYDKEEALEWIKATAFPIVFKTRSGAGSSNVKLIKNRAMAKRLIQKSFGSGIPNYSKVHYFLDSLWKLRRDKTLYSLGRVCKYALLLFVSTKYQVQYLIEKDYIYFQEFIPGNDSDIRIVVIGSRAFALKRFVRENDFRASGSGVFSYDPSVFPIELVQSSFQACQSLKSQSVAFDYIYDFQQNAYKIVEISYAFSHQAYYQCPGYWDEKLQWHEGTFFPEYFLIEDFVSVLDENQ